MLITLKTTMHNNRSLSNNPDDLLILTRVKAIKTPPIMQVLKIIDPTAFPIAIPLAFAPLEIMVTKSSGIVVPIVTNVAPIIGDGIFNFFAMTIDESTNLFPPETIRQKDDKKIITITIIYSLQTRILYSTARNIKK